MSRAAEQPSHPEHGRRARPILACAILLIGALACVHRARVLGDTEPRVDHAHFSVWVQDVGRAPHLLPRADPGQSHGEALASDRGSQLHQLLRRVFNQPYRAFNLSSFAVMWLATRVLGDTFRDLVLISIAASAVTVALSGLVLLALAERLPGARRTLSAAAILASAFTALSFYLHSFSAQGWHNVAIASTMLLAWIAVRMTFTSGRPGLGSIAGLAVALALALHSYFLMPWLAVPAFAVQAIAARGRRDGLKWATGFAALAFGVALPAAALVAKLWPQAVAGVKQLEPSGAVLERSIQWFEHGASTLSIAGTAIALAGLVWLARLRFPFPLVFVAGCFALSAISGRAGGSAWHRTWPYALPFLLVGASWFTAGAFAFAVRARRTRPLAAVLAGGTALAGGLGLVVHNVGALASTERACKAIPSYCEKYLGPPRLRAIVDEVDLRLPQGASLLPTSYIVSDLYRVLSSRRDVNVLLPLDALGARLASGELAGYVTARVDRPPSGAIFVLAREHDGPVEAPLRGVLGAQGTGWRSGRVEIEALASWDTLTDASDDYGTLTLLAVPDSAAEP